MSAILQLTLLDPAEELAAAKADPNGRELSPAAQAAYMAEGAVRFAERHGSARHICHDEGYSPLVKPCFACISQLSINGRRRRG